ncbi:MAG: 3-oxoacyl-ACP reductase FabG [Spirochaetota bacterium]
MSNYFSDLKDKVVVITGSGRGIGKGIAEEFANAGSKLVINDINQETAEATASEFGAKGVETLAIACDISKQEQVQDFFKQIVEKWGKVDVLINNAGITQDTLFLRMKLEQWQRVIDINLTGTFLCTHAAIKYMSKAKSGNIINISSINRLGQAGQANYSASKAGVVGFSKTIAKEFASRSIRCNVIAPGFISTPMTAAMTDKAKEAAISQIPLSRAGEPADIANLALFLASDLSSYITGQTIDINGGLT